ncbi:MAG TPA: FtsX-like permease family protein, partial [Methanomassiliicoccales archaeon]|nr:FtsX-like permease family protein [Methanomassiliicoccales archaeon]
MGIELFIISGLFMVTSALIIVIFNSDSIVNFITKVFRVKGGYRAVIKTAVSYPLRAKFRTGLSIFIFGLVIFTVTTMSMMSGILAVGIPKIVEESSGGFDVVAYKTLPVPFPDDPWNMINNSQGFVHGENVSNMVSISSMPVSVQYTNFDAATGNLTYHSKGSSVMGFDASFHTVGSFPLKDWNRTIYPTEADVWNAVLSDPSLVILDSSWQSTISSPFMNMGDAGTVEVGQTIMVVSYFGPMENVTVVGVMKQSFFNGVFMSKPHAESFYLAMGAAVMMINFADGLDVQEQAALLERQFLPYGVATVNVAAIAKMITNMIDNIFTLIQAFLSIGLVIGIVGLGIITIRSIHERKLEIGMMRAIGYKKRMVVANFAIESAFISALGILIGTILGIAVGYDMYQTAFSGGDYQFDFVINWVPIVLIGAGAFIATLLSVYPASRGASRISPAEVLRFE